MSNSSGKDETVLQEAQRLVHGDRGADYGHPIEDFYHCGRIWAAILSRHFKVYVPDIPPHVVALMMSGLKVNREAGKPKRDNRVDCPGYMECEDLVINAGHTLDKLEPFKRWPDLGGGHGETCTKAPDQECDCFCR